MAEILSTLSLNGDQGSPSNPGGGQGTGDFYQTMSASESGEQSDLVAAGNTHVLECYGDFPTGLEDNVAISGWTTDVTNFITVRAAAGHAHGGVSKAGFYMVESATAADIMNCTQGYTVLQDIEAINTRASFNSASCIRLTHVHTLERVMCSMPNITGGTSYGIECSSLANTVSTLRNCTVGPMSSSSATGIIQDGSSPNYIDAANCTVIGCGSRGYFIKADDIIKNCLAFDCGASDFDGSPSASSTNNASEDGTAPGSNPVTGVVAGDFVDYAGGDYTPAASGALDGAGVDLSGDFTDDIAGNTRSVPWEIGAYEIASGPVGAVLSAHTTTAVAETTATIGCTTDTSGGILYWYLSESDQAPSATDLKAGTGAVQSSSLTPTAGQETVDLTGLDPSTTYWHYWIQETT